MLRSAEKAGKIGAEMALCELKNPRVKTKNENGGNVQ